MASNRQKQLTRWTFRIFMRILKKDLYYYKYFGL